ncbi:glycosyltransferase family 2 protein [uncultured Draconibacterium sp.]|uniref:glycosyltransferase family 2 protein n=1 Tax=uncultured Draconibacterium sp. TaxID=1573823 RepID=UPI002AA68E58|nr:glycosyltransferase family 2 protein [uncultured Draconibacterium sp.]
MKEKIYVVLVTYEPNIETLNKCINSLVSQVKKIIIVDNTPLRCKELDFLNHKDIEIIYLNDNFGIAYAQNIGVKKALSENTDFVLFSDQDTIYGNDYIDKLLLCFNEYKNNKRIAAVAPVYRDINSMEIQPMVYFKNLRLLKTYDLEKCESVSHVISSGMLIPSNIFSKVGYLQEELFIDWVDTEWCWRALLLNYEILQTPKVIIEHEHGSYSKKLLGKNVPIHNNPMRNYYRLRNATYMLIHSDLNLAMKLNLLKRIRTMIPIHFLTTKNKNEEIIRIFKSLKDGMIKKLGK